MFGFILATFAYIIYRLGGFEIIFWFTFIMLMKGHYV